MHPQSFFGCSFKGIGLLETNDSKNETLGQGATFAFGPKKKYYFTKKLQPKTFLSPKSIHRFSNNKILVNIELFSTKMVISHLIFFTKMLYHFQKWCFNEKNKSLEKSWIIISMQNFVRNPFLATINATERNLGNKIRITFPICISFSQDSSKII